jgi:taurine dioxygenase
VASIEVRSLGDDIPFGARIGGVTVEALEHPEIRQQINAVFEDRGMIVFEGVDPTTETQIRISEVFGPLKDHPSKTTTRVDADKWLGVIAISATPDMCVVEIEGEPLISYQPWHFDHCYNDELNRAGVLRAAVIPPEGGRTLYADGIQIYQALSPDLRAKLEDLSIIYTLDLLYPHQRFGLPKTFKQLRPFTHADKMLENARTFPRAIHPAVWTRATGEQVVHMCGYMAVGIEHQETPEGEALFDEVWEAISEAIVPYVHSWREDEMVVWDNWRMLHEACGCDPKYDRVMHRTTIKGDYGLGRFEHGARPTVAAPSM